MKTSALLGYQWLTGISDAGTGVLLCIAPAFTLRIMGVRAPGDAMPFVSYVGAFVLSVGLACLYGAYLVIQRDRSARLEMVWLLTAFTRGAVSIFIVKEVLIGELEVAWLGVAVFDALCVAIQSAGLRKGWLAYAR
jgi:hypothetical protein